jgi:hypothetical protein
MPEENLEVVIDYDSITTQIKATYSELLDETAKNAFYKSTLDNITAAVTSLAISEEKKAEAYITFYSQMANETLSKTFDQAIKIVEIAYKLPKELNKLDKDFDIATQQELELKESVTDRQEKRPIEVTNLRKQGVLICAQTAKMREDKRYVLAQKTSMLEQVEHNKIIKAMDSMGDMIGTLGNGGIKPSTKMFEIYFELNKLLTEIEAPTNTELNLTKIT